MRGGLNSPSSARRSSQQKGGINHLHALCGARPMIARSTVMLLAALDLKYNDTSLSSLFFCERVML